MNTLRTALILALFVCATGCSSGGGDDAVETSAAEMTSAVRVTCESWDGTYRSCDVDTHGGKILRTHLVRQLSTAPCIEGSTYGNAEDYVWVDRGCRAEIEVRVTDSGGGTDGEPEIQLFEHSRFRGRNVVLHSAVVNFQDIGFNDIVSSFIVRSGTWTLCERKYYDGICETYGPGEYKSLNGGLPNDSMSSAKPSDEGHGHRPDPGHLRLRWSNAGPIHGLSCVAFSEPADPDTWGDNYLCTDYDVGLRWSSAGPINGMHCIAISEPADPHTWNDNYLCSPRDYGLVWSFNGPISNYDCTAVVEPSDPHTWNDNYLCVRR